MQPMQHLFAWTEPLPELAGAAVEIEHPILRHQDRAMYFRQRGEGYGIGAYGHDPITIEPRELERHPDGHQIATGPFSQEHWPESLGWAHELLPPLAGVGIAETFNRPLLVRASTTTRSPGRRRRSRACGWPTASGSRTAAAPRRPSST
jgi:hypothetical protein